MIPGAARSPAWLEPAAAPRTAAVEATAADFRAVAAMAAAVAAATPTEDRLSLSLDE